MGFIGTDYREQLNEIFKDPSVASVTLSYRNGNLKFKGCEMAGFQKILEIEHICDPVKILLTREGKIEITPLPGKEKPALETLKMPPQQFWDNCASLIKNMSEHINRLTTVLGETQDRLNVATQDTQKLVTEVDSLKKQIEETGKKYIPVNSGKKEMFIAGVTFGKGMKK